MEDYTNAIEPNTKQHVDKDENSNWEMLSAIEDNQDNNNKIDEDS